MSNVENNLPFGHMPPEPVGLPSPEDIRRIEIAVWEAQEGLQSAFLTKDRDLALESHRVITGDSEAELPAQIDEGIAWRTREEIEAGLTTEQRVAVEERVRELKIRLGITSVEE